MSISFDDIDLSSVVDEMESMISQSTNNRVPDRSKDWVEGLKSRVTASGFTESDSETVSVLPKKLSHKQINDRLKLARDVSGLMRMLELDISQVEYCNEMINRFSNRNAFEDPKSVQHQDIQMINSLSALSTIEMKKMAGEVRDDLHEMKESFKSVVGIGKKRRDSVVSDSDTILADDSASRVASRMYNHQRPRLQDQVTQSSFAGSRLSSIVVGGYRSNLTALDEDEEVEIAPVLGLPRIFVDDELNFLCHLHKPLMELLTENGKYPCDNIFSKLDKFMKRHRGRDREPEANLLYMVIKHTFSLSRMQVKQNRFSLPLLEEGMHLDEELIYMCVEQLYSKFEMMWFTSMKAVKVPDFHSKYKNRFSSAPVRRSTAPTKKSTRSVLNF